MGLIQVRTTSGVPRVEPAAPFVERDQSTGIRLRAIGELGSTVLDTIDKIDKDQSELELAEAAPLIRAAYEDATDFSQTTDDEFQGPGSLDAVLTPRVNQMNEALRAIEDKDYHPTAKRRVRALVAATRGRANAQIVSGFDDRLAEAQRNRIQFQIRARSREPVTQEELPAAEAEIHAILGTDVAKKRYSAEERKDLAETEITNMRNLSLGHALHLGMTEVQVNAAFQRATDIRTLTPEELQAAATNQEEFIGQRLSRFDEILSKLPESSTDKRSLEIQRVVIEARAAAEQTLMIALEQGQLVASRDQALQQIDEPMDALEQGLATADEALEELDKVIHDPKNRKALGGDSAADKLEREHYAAIIAFEVETGLGSPSTVIEMAEKIHANPGRYRDPRHRARANQAFANHLLGMARSVTSGLQGMTPGNITGKVLGAFGQAGQLGDVLVQHEGLVKEAINAQVATEIGTAVLTGTRLAGQTALAMEDVARIESGEMQSYGPADPRGRAAALARLQALVPLLESRDPSLGPTKAKALFDHVMTYRMTLPVVVEHWNRLEGGSVSDQLAADDMIERIDRLTSSRAIRTPEFAERERVAGQFIGKLDPERVDRARKRRTLVLGGATPEEANRDLLAMARAKKQDTTAGKFGMTMEDLIGKVANHLDRFGSPAEDFPGKLESAEARAIPKEYYDDIMLLAQAAMNRPLIQTDDEALADAMKRGESFWGNSKFGGKRWMRNPVHIAHDNAALPAGDWVMGAVMSEIHSIHPGVSFEEIDEINLPHPTDPNRTVVAFVLKGTDQYLPEEPLAGPTQTFPFTIPVGPMIIEPAFEGSPAEAMQSEFTGQSLELMTRIAQELEITGEPLAARILSELKAKVSEKGFGFGAKGSMAFELGGVKLQRKQEGAVSEAMVRGILRDLRKRYQGGMLETVSQSFANAAMNLLQKHFPDTAKAQIDKFMADATAADLALVRRRENTVRLRELRRLRAAFLKAPRGSKALNDLLRTAQEQIELHENLLQNPDALGRLEDVVGGFLTDQPGRRLELQPPAVEAMLDEHQRLTETLKVLRAGLKAVEGGQPFRLERTSPPEGRRP